MQQTRHRQGRARFGAFEIDIRAGELRKHGLRIRLQEQPFQVLLMLIERPQELVTRDELRKRLWSSDTFVDFDHGVNKAINKIRDALGDLAQSPRFVETVARRGYRFVADVSVVDGDLVSDPGFLIEGPSGSKVLDFAAPAPNSQVNKELRWPGVATTIGMVVVLAASILLVWILSSRSRALPGIESLAVLPLENLSGDASQDYFADGMTDELITNLGQISALQVISRTSVMMYRHSGKTLPQIARELNVDAVVEGSVLRSGERVRITAQLIRASDDKHLWAHSYEGGVSETLALQSQVSQAIAEQIRIHLTPGEQAVLRNSKVVNPEAYESYLKGRYFWNKRTGDGLKRAIEYFDQAVAKDPKYAQAYSGLADSYALLGDWEYGILTPREAFPKVKAAATKALQLDSSLGEAHTSLAFSMDLFDWDWKSAETEFKRAIALNPGYATARQWYAWHLVILGRDSEAVTELRKAETLDPLSLIIHADLADALLIAGHPSESIQESRKTIEMDPYFAVGHYELGQALVQEQIYGEAIPELQKAIKLSGGSAACTSNLAYAYAVSGKRNEAEDILDDLKNRSNAALNAPEIALIYVGLDEKDQAIAWLQKAYTERFNPSILMRPSFDPMRADPRF